MYPQPFENPDPNLPPKGFSSRIYAYRSLANQVIPSGVFTRSQMNIVLFDSLGEYDTALWQWTATKAGYYYMCASCRFMAAAAAGNIQMDIIRDLDSQNIARDFTTLVLGDAKAMFVACVFYALAGAAYYVRIRQTTGFNLTFNNGIGNHYFCVHKLS